MEWPCVELANSQEWDAHGNPTEHLDDPKWVAEFISRNRLPLGRGVNARELRAALAAFRAELRPALERVAASGGKVTEHELKPLRSALSAVSWRRVLALSPGGPSFSTEPDGPGTAAVVAEVAASAARLLTSTDTSRIKVCSNSLCRWIFVDETKGNVRRWCHDVLCGRLDRVRRFRQRERADGAQHPAHPRRGAPRGSH